MSSVALTAARLVVLPLVLLNVFVAPLASLPAADPQAVSFAAMIDAVRVAAVVVSRGD